MGSFMGGEGLTAVQGSGGLGALLGNLGQISSAFGAQSGGQDINSMIDSFVSNLVQQPQVRGAETTPGPALGAIQDRLLVGRAGPPTTDLGPIQDRLITPPQLSAPILPPILPGVGDPLAPPRPRFPLDRGFSGIAPILR